LSDEDGHSLPELLDDHERRLILAALARADWRQARAAARLGVRTSTLHAKMKRLAIHGRHLVAQGVARELDPGQSFQWEGALPPGSTVEVRGVKGSLRARPAPGADVQLVAIRPRRAGAGRMALSVVESERGLTVSVAQVQRSDLDARAPLRLGGLEVDFQLLLPRGLHLVARLFDGDIDVVGVHGRVDAETLHGRVRIAGDGGGATDHALGSRSNQPERAPSPVNAASILA
jgi:hypothetical protein